VEVPTVDAATARPQEIINLYRPDLPGDDTAIFEVVLEQLLSDPEESGVEVSESATPVIEAC
jgi:hypothetical protein